MGRVSLYGVIPLTYTRDHPGPLARDAVDAAIMLQAMAGPDDNDPRSQGLPSVARYVRATEPVDRAGTSVPEVAHHNRSVARGTRTGTPMSRPSRRRAMSENDAAARAARRTQRRASEAAARAAMLTRFEELGARVVEIEPPPDWETLTSRNFNNVRLPERSEPFLEVLKRDVREFGVSLSPWVNGLLLSGTEYLRGPTGQAPVAAPGDGWRVQPVRRRCPNQSGSVRHDRVAPHRVPQSGSSRRRAPNYLWGRCWAGYRTAKTACSRSRRHTRGSRIGTAASRHPRHRAPSRVRESGDGRTCSTSWSTASSSAIRLAGSGGSGARGWGGE